jgi:hypothetical protein
LWQYRPRGSALLFFDVKPVAIKAYGGRRYSKKRLVLSRAQKTHGLIYLFVAYEYNSGRRVWGFYPGKSSQYVCRFLKKIRSRYGNRELRLALDRDSLHPIKAPASTARTSGGGPPGGGGDSTITEPSRHPLHDGDELRVCNNVFAVVLAEGQTPSREASAAAASPGRPR